MKLNYRRIILPMAVALLACSAASAGRDPEELAAPLMKLTRAVEAELVYGDGGDRLTDAQLLEAAMTGDPALRKEFKGTHLVLQHNQRRVIVLVCSPDAKVGWIEDASWTPAVDKHWYRATPKHPCSITLKLNETQTLGETLQGARN